MKAIRIKATAAIKDGSLSPMNAKILCCPVIFAASIKMIPGMLAIAAMIASFSIMLLLGLELIRFVPG